MDHKSVYEIQNHRLLEDNMGENLDDLGLVMLFKIKHQGHNP